MDRGEAGVLAGQFVALVIVLLVLSNFALGTGNGISPLSNPNITAVYWGSPAGNIQLTKAATTVETTNATTISAFYTLAYSTSPALLSATRLCLDPNANDTGAQYIYANVTLLYDAEHKSNYISFGSTRQLMGQTCTYTITLTDSLQQIATWVGTVQVKSNATQ